MARRASRRRKTGLYYPRKVPLAAIKRYARAIAQRFDPDKIILFGSYAYGKPTPDSDVDLLVVMPTRNAADQGVKIEEALEREGFGPPFFMDLLVRTPGFVRRQLRAGDSFIGEVVSRGLVLHEKASGPLGQESGVRSTHGGTRRQRQAARTGRRLLSLPADGRKVPQGAARGAWTASAKNS